MDLQNVHVCFYYFMDKLGNVKYKLEENFTFVCTVEIIICLVSTFGNYFKKGLLTILNGSEDKRNSNR